jgi:hypothetical protein
MMGPGCGPVGYHDKKIRLGRRRIKRQRKPEVIADKRGDPPRIEFATNYSCSRLIVTMLLSITKKVNLIILKYLTILGNYA